MAGFKCVVIQARVVLSLGDDQDVVVEVFIDHVPGCFIGILQAADTQAFALAHGVVHQAIVFAQGFTTIGLNAARLCRQVALQKGIETSFADEADAGAVFLVVCGQLVFARDLAHFVFGQFTHGKQGMFKLVVIQGMQKITLVLVVIDAAQQLCLSVR